MSSCQYLAHPKLYHTQATPTPGSREGRQRQSCQHREASWGVGKGRRDSWECWHFGSLIVKSLNPTVSQARGL